MGRFRNWKPPKIKHGELTKWNWMVQYPENLKLGKYVDIGAFTYINAKHGVEIGDNVQIGSHCSIYSESTIDNKKGKVTIDRGVRIGTHTTIMPNVKIHFNTIIGAYSFVKNDLPPNTICWGIPCKVRKIREGFQTTVDHKHEWHYDLAWVCKICGVAMIDI